MTTSKKTPNSVGRPPLRRDLKGVKLLTQQDVSRLMQKMMDMSLVDLQDMVDDPTTPAMELMLARIIEKAMREGDHQRLNFLFDRTIGKVVDKKEVEIRPVRYVTGVEADGTLVQQVLEEEENSDG